jgi:hypothetical protein
LKESALEVRQNNKNLPAEENLYLLLSFYDSYIYYYNHKNIIRYVGSLQPMTVHTFNNEYDIVMWVLSQALDCFEKEDKLFAAHYISWITSILPFMEVLSYY